MHTEPQSVLDSKQHLPVIEQLRFAACAEIWAAASPAPGGSGHDCDDCGAEGMYSTMYGSMSELQIESRHLQKKRLGSCGTCLPPLNEVLPKSVCLPARGGAAITAVLTLPDVCAAVTNDNIQILELHAHPLHVNTQSLSAKEKPGKRRIMRQEGLQPHFWRDKWISQGCI